MWHSHPGCAILLATDKSMETLLPTSLGNRRNEDIALDLLKFIATHTDFVKSGSLGFQQSGGSKSEDQVDRLLQLYVRCLTAVEGKHK